MKLKVATLLMALSLAPALQAEPGVLRDSAESNMRHGGGGHGYGPGRPGPRPPRPGYPGPSYRWECASENRRGHRFYSVDYDRYWAERQAQNSCLAYSRFCRPIGCRTVRF